MKIYKFKEVNIEIAKNQPQYLTLPSYVVPNTDNGEVICCWKLSFIERLKLLFTGKIWHHILTFKNDLQPQKLSLNKPLCKL